MNEIAPGILHWTGIHPKIKVEVSSYFHEPSGTLIDPLYPDLERIEPQRVVLTNRHHLRSATDAGVPILCHEAGLHEFEGGPEVRGFRWGDELAPGIRALEVDAICPEETALLIEGGHLALADAVMRYGGNIGFVPDEYLVDDPSEAEGVKRAIKEALRRLLDQPFDSILFAHGEPRIGGAKEELRAFVDAG